MKEEIIIPEQLRRKEFRFCRVKGKKPFDPNWNVEGGSNYPYYHPIIKGWIGSGGNYGIVCGVGNIVVIDCDQPDLEDAVRKQLPKTFVVRTSEKSPSWRGKHFYYITDIPYNSTYIRNSNGKNIGEIKGTLTQVVGPTCYHYDNSGKKTGWRYEILENRPISKITCKQLDRLVELFKPKINVEEVTNNFKVDTREKYLKAFGLKVDDIIDISNLRHYRNGIYNGPHPIHSSETGRNFYVDVEKGVWWCFRHTKVNAEGRLICAKGGILGLIAMKHDLCKCEDFLDNNPLRDKEIFKHVLAIAKEKYGVKIPKKYAKTEDQTVRRSFIEIDGRLYLEVFTNSKEFKFATLDEHNEVIFVDEIKLNGNTTVKPVPLPKKAGEYLDVVKLPSESIREAPLLPVEVLLKEIQNHIYKYLDTSDLDRELDSYYILFTWFYPKVDTLPYRRFIGDTGKGKSRALNVVGDLCFYPISVSGAGSLSGAMRTVERWRGTMIIDEADFKGDKESKMIKYLNLGFERGKYFVLSDKQNPRHQEWFDPFCPKVIAMRNPFRDNATEGRLLSTNVYETGRLDIPIILKKTYLREAQDLRDKIAKFVLANWSKVNGEELEDFSDLEIEPRLKQLAMPLSVIFQLWDKGKKRFKEYLLKRQKELKRIRAQSWEGLLFNFVLSVANGEETLSEYDHYYDDEGHIQAVTPSMVAKAFKSSAKAVTQGLTSIGFEVETSNIYLKDKKRKTVKRYVVPNENVWREIVKRYYEEDTVPPIPECLKSKKYIEACVYRTVTSVTSVTDKEKDSKSVTVVTDVTLPHTRNDNIFIQKEMREIIDKFLKFIEDNKKDEFGQLKGVSIEELDKFWQSLPKKVGNLEDLIELCKREGEIYEFTPGYYAR